MNLLNHRASVLSIIILVLGACSSNSSNPNDGGQMPADPEQPEENPGNPVMGSQTLPDGLIGPLGGTGLNNEYSQFADSPFANIDFSRGYFYFEDFEDNIFEHPGAAADVGNFVTLAFGPGFHDSVDNDDGLIDGDSLQGESWFFDDASEGVTWTFSAAALGGQLPTMAGIVWTDGRGQITFDAYDSQGNLIDSIISDHADSTFNGTTADDRFYGVVHSSGISAISLRSADRLNGIEVDHLQWGYIPNN